MLRRGFSVLILERMKAPEKGDHSHSLPLLVGPREIELRRVVLTGFMGSGKSTVGPLVARLLGWNFVDVDDVIAAEAGCSIPEIFRDEGEKDFRRRERETIARLASGDALVLALGGGAIEDAETRGLLLENRETLVCASRRRGTGDDARIAAREPRICGLFLQMRRISPAVMSVDCRFTAWRMFRSMSTRSLRSRLRMRLCTLQNENCGVIKGG